MRRIALASLAAAVGIATSFASADARPRKATGVSKTLPNQSASRASRSDDRGLANSYDPSGNYGAYPEWARRALSPRTGGPGK